MSNFGYVQTKSKLKIVTSASGAYSSSIRSYAYDIGSQSYSGLENTYTMGEVVRDSGTVAVTVTVTDSRGRTASKTVSITVLAYSPPQITHFECSRCGDANGSANANGQYLKVTFGYSVSQLNNKNKASYLLKYSVYDDGKWGGLISGTQYTYSGTYISATAILNTASTYQIGLVVTDSFGTASFYKEIGTAVRLLSYIVKRFAIAIGKIPEIDNIFDVALESIFRKKVSMYSDLKVNGTINTDKDIGTYASMWFNNPANHSIFVTLSDGSQIEAVNWHDGNNMSIGWGNYSLKKGGLCLGGVDISHRISATANNTEYRPYYRRGDTIDVYLHTSGYATTGGKDILFLVPLSKPIIDSPTVSVSSINGLVLRQNNSYPHNSSNYCKPASYRVTDVTHAFGFNVRASFDNNTGVTNNSPIGIVANIRITFS
ncbi:MAG: hypothetical protein ACLRQ8_11285 [Coprococcus sp.]